MATAAKKPVEGFPESPYAFAEQIRKEREERKKLRVEKEAKRAKATNPHNASAAQGPRRLGIRGEVIAACEKRGIELSWIRLDEWDEYQEKGYQKATTDDVGKDALTRGRADEASDSGRAFIQRGNMLLVKCPLGWRKDRMTIEQHQAIVQAGKDPFDEEFGQQRGQFGKGSRRRAPKDALDVDEEDED